jgi:hypothetical protein
MGVQVGVEEVTAGFGARPLRGNCPAAAGAGYCASPVSMRLDAADTARPGTTAPMYAHSSPFPQVRWPDRGAGDPGGSAGRAVRVRPDRLLRPGRRPGRHQHAGLAAGRPADAHRCRGRGHGAPFPGWHGHHAGEALCGDPGRAAAPVRAATWRRGAAGPVSLVVCQNSCGAPDLVFYPQHSCSFVSSTCS